MPQIWLLWFLIPKQMSMQLCWSLLFFLHIWTCENYKFEFCWNFTEKKSDFYMSSTHRLCSAKWYILKLLLGIFILLHTISYVFSSGREWEMFINTKSECIMWTCLHLFTCGREYEKYALTFRMRVQSLNLLCMRKRWKTYHIHMYYNIIAVHCHSSVCFNFFFIISFLVLSFDFICYGKL